MKLYRARQNGSVFYATQRDGVLRRSAAKSLAEALAGVSKPLEPIELSEVEILAPVQPGKIVAVGRNYADHAKELGNDVPAEPILFLKPPSAVIGPEDVIELPRSSQRVDFEGELAIVVGRTARHVSRSQWKDYVAGFTCANDVTARDLQKRDVQFTRGKSFDTFCPLGPLLQTELDPADLAISTRLNGEIRQSGRTSSLIFPPSVLLEFISAIMTLDPGDVILTGTPAGVGPMQDGDIVEVTIEGIGTLRNRVGK